MSLAKTKAGLKGKSTPTPSVDYLLKEKGEGFGPTLQTIVDNPSPKQSVFGVVLDVTGAYKTYDSIDYVVKLKIIDGTFNHKENLTSYKSFVHVFIYSDTPETAPRATRIGDIIKLVNFDFRTYQNSEVKALFHKGQSDWAMFDGRRSAHLTVVSKSKNYNTKLSDNDKEKIKSLRDWAEEFFQADSLKLMNWFAREENQTPKEGAVIEVKDVDLVAKLLCDNVYIIDDKLYHKLAFADEERNLYFAEFEGTFSTVTAGDIVKLRSIIILIALESRKIQFSSYSNILILQKTSLDYIAVDNATENLEYNQKDLELQEFEELHLDKMQKIQIGLNTFAYVSPDGSHLGLINAETLRTNFVRGYPLLENFSHGDDDFVYQDNTGYKFFSKRGSAFLKQHGNGIYYTFKELTNIQNEILMNPELASQYQHQKFLVRGFILATETDQVFQTAKLYSPSLNRVWDFDFHADAKEEATDLQVILHNVFYMKDQSIDTEQTTFPVYLITFDGNPQVPHS